MHPNFYLTSTQMITTQLPKDDRKEYLHDKEKNIFSTDVEKALDKVQRPFMIKILNKIGTKGNFLNITETIYEKSQLNHNQCRKTDNFFLRFSTRQGCPLLPLLFNIVLEIL